MCTVASAFGLARRARDGAESKKIAGIGMVRTMKLQAEVCAKCEGTGWKTVSAGGDRRVAPCDCRLKDRTQTLLVGARIPKRYEHCELSEFYDGFSGSARVARAGASGGDPFCD